MAAKHLNHYLDEIRSRGNPGLADSIAKTASEVGDRHLKNFSFLSHEIGLLFGNVQSGKTAQLFGIICEAADLGFSVFVLLTTDNILLQQQTLERVQRDLSDFCICGENDSTLFKENNLRKPAIIVLKKNSRVLRLWANTFLSTGFLRGNPLFIVDDEADASSLNTKVNSGGQSSINKYLEAIKSSASSSLYLQVTGTPQALFLQTSASGWHPMFAYSFRPGAGYLGGEFFFPSEGKPECIEFIDELDHPEKDAVLRHLAVSAQILGTGGKVCNCVFHPSVRQNVHQKFANLISSELAALRALSRDELALRLKPVYDELKPAKSEKFSFDVMLGGVSALLQPGGVKVLVLNGKYDVESSEYASGCNFAVGGNTLGRGVTFPSLQTIFYTRSSKNPQADTMWQHSRMFGYDRDPGLMKVYIEKRLYKIFSELNAANKSIESQIESGLKNIKIYYSKDIRPTRRNVIDQSEVATVIGGTNYYPYDPDNDSIETISELLKPFSDTEPYYQVSLRLIREILTHIIPSPDFRLKAFQSVIDALLSNNPGEQAILLVHRNRNVAQGTGALVSSNDWAVGGQFRDRTVLTMYQVTGTKGWHGKPLWVPNIKLPDGVVYYDVADS